MTWANQQLYPVRHTKADHGFAAIKIVVGGSGAVTSSNGSPGVSAAKDAGTGVYNLTFPKCSGITLTGWSLKSAAGTVKTLWVVAYDASAGTAQIAIGNGGGTATNPASGDEIHLQFDVQLSSVD